MALRKYGFVKISKNKTYVYPVILKEYEVVDKENKQSGEKIIFNNEVLRDIKKI